jgi:hypothetical protein
MDPILLNVTPHLLVWEHPHLDVHGHLDLVDGGGGRQKELPLLSHHGPHRHTDKSAPIHHLLFYGKICQISSLIFPAFLSQYFSV